MRRVRRVSGHRQVGRERGVALIMAIVIMFILTAMGLALVFSTTTEFQIAGAETVATKTFYSADSGIQYAFAQAKRATYTGPGCTVSGTAYSNSFCFDVAERSTLSTTNSITVRVAPLRVVDYQLAPGTGLDIGSLPLYNVTRHADSFATDTTLNSSRQVGVDMVIGPVPLSIEDLN
ncbi:MAG: pilus assembly PilX family protein [Thermoanaerobaculia bacterium]